MNIIKLMPHVGLAIRHYREKNRLSNKELAKASKVSESYITMLEKGERGKRISYNVLAKISAALNVTVEELEAWKPPKNEWLDENYFSLGPDEQKQVEDLIVSLKEKKGKGSDAEAPDKRKTRGPG